MLNVEHEAMAGGARALRLSGALGIATAARAREQLLEALSAAPAGPVHLDTSGLGEVDSAGVQLLLAAARQLAQEGRPATAGPPAVPLARVAQALGVGDEAQCCGFAITAAEAAA